MQPIRMVVLAGLLFASFVAPARADVLPPTGAPSCASARTAPCAGKKVGETCNLEAVSGVCQALRCTSDAGETLLACDTSSPPTTSTPDGGCSSAPPSSSRSSWAGLGLVFLFGILARRRASRGSDSPRLVDGDVECHTAGDSIWQFDSEQTLILNVPEMWAFPGDFAWNGRFIRAVVSPVFTNSPPALE